MRDTELYFHLLGLVKPWSVESIELSVEKLRVDVKVEHPTGYVWQCPQCAHQGALYDHSDERTWRHLDCASRFGDTARWKGLRRFCD